MNLKLPDFLERCRITEGMFGSPYNSGPSGAFEIASPFGGTMERLRIISSDAELVESKGWEHVSVSLQHRCPTWDEMAYVKGLFWSELETVIQFHPRKSEYVNCHPYCLHMWRNTRQTIELPPRFMI